MVMRPAAGTCTILLQAMSSGLFRRGERKCIAACAVNERIKKNKALLHFYFELDAENKNIPALLGLDNYSVFVKNKTFTNVDLIHELPLFNTPGWKDAGFVVAGNATSVQTVRRALKQHAVAGSIIAQAYWAAGKTGL
jgi:NADPH-dependent ferric siderophore reductase